MSKSKIVVIIGGGPSGLTAAYELLKKSNHRVIVLEESNEIGGISRTVRYKGNRIDIGGHRFFSKSDRIMNWWKSIMPLQGSPSRDDILLDRNKTLDNTGPDPEKDKKVMLLRERISRIYYTGKFFDYPISIRIQTLLNMGLLKTFQAGSSYLYSSIFKKEEKSLEDFLVNRFGNALYSMFFENYTEKVWGVHPSQISAEWGAQRIKALSLRKVLLDILKKPFISKEDIYQKKTDTSLIKQFLYPKYGPGQLWETVADEIKEMGGKIFLNCKVININANKDKITSLSYVTKGKEYTISGDEFLSSMPIRDLVNGISGGEIPQNVKEVASNLPYRDFMTMGILANKLKLKNETNIKTIGNIIPDCWIYVQEPNVKLGRLQIFNNWSPYMVEDFENTVWIGLEYFCNEGDRMWKMSDKDFISFASRELETIGIINSSDILDSVRIKVKKAYPAYFGTYKDFDIVKNYLDAFKNLSCIGRNGQHRYNNMDHSMLTAMEAVSNILNDKVDKSNIWAVNTEDEYHEVQEKKVKPYPSMSQYKTY